MNPLPEHGRVPRVVWASGGLICLLALFMVENIWIDPWLRSKSRHFPTLVPDPLGGMWLLAFVLVAIACALLIVSEILLVRERGRALGWKLGMGVAVLGVLLLAAEWFGTTTGLFSAKSLLRRNRHHSVTLTWDRSAPPAVGYNIYRSAVPGSHYARLNSELVRVPNYKDQTVEGGKTYYYVTKAVGPTGNESAPSNEVVVRIPLD